MPRLNLWLIRHGETDFNRGIISDNPQQTPLSALGLKQAQRATQAISTQPDYLIVSPLPRTRETAEAIQVLWPNTAMEYWPIFEFNYISCARMQSADRKLWIKNYWELADPEFSDTQDTESFAEFLGRVAQFYEQVIQLEGFVVAVGHGQFFKAFLMGLQSGFEASPQWMRQFRAEETRHPIHNGEIIRLCFN